MSRKVDADRIELIVGAHRHPVEHIARAIPPEGLIYILHSDECRALYNDLRDCPWSLALDRTTEWTQTDEPVIARVRDGRLIAHGPVPEPYQATWSHEDSFRILVSEYVLQRGRAEIQNLVSIGTLDPTEAFVRERMLRVWIETKVRELKVDANSASIQTLRRTSAELAQLAIRILKAMAGTL